MNVCTNPSTHKITILDSKKIIKKCADCFARFQIMTIGYEDKYSVEIQN